MTTENPKYPGSKTGQIVGGCLFLVIVIFVGRYFGSIVGQQAAEERLAEERQRNLGFHEESYTNLVQMNAGGTKEDLDLFLNGEKLVWDSTGHTKAKGIRMKISYPRTWKAAEGSRPNIVQKFTSDSGLGIEMVMVQTRALPKPYDRDLTEKEKQEVLSLNKAKEFIPDGGRFVSHKVTKIDGELCAMIEFELVSERVGIKIGQKVLMFIIPRKGVLLGIQCSTGGDASSGFDAINKHYEEVKPLFLLISSSCVLTEKWRTP